MIAEGVLSAAGTLPAAAYALHVMASPWTFGVFQVGAGPIMASADRIDVTMTGPGGHASTPHLAADPLAAAAEAVLTLPQAVARSRNPVESAVFNIGAFHSGTEPNIIPSTATFAATLRVFDETVRSRSLESVELVCRSVAAAHRVQAEIRVLPKYPVSVNSAGAAERARQVLTRVVGADRVIALPEPLFGSEDFATVLGKVPGAMVFLGAASGDSDAWNHSPHVLFDDTVLPQGCAFYAAMVLSHLAPHLLD
jgi:amidohydrolase